MPLASSDRIYQTTGVINTLKINVFGVYITPHVFHFLFGVIYTLGTSGAIGTRPAT